MEIVLRVYTLYLTTSFSESSKDKVIESLKRRIPTLEEENKNLKRENTILLGKLSKL